MQRLLVFMILLVSLAILQHMQAIRAQFREHQRMAMPGLASDDRLSNEQIELMLIDDDR